MSKTGLIYEIVCNETYERYVGSTFEPTVARRIAGHKFTKTCMSRQIIDRNNYSYGLLETVLVNTRDELRMYERKWYDALDCINRARPYVTKTEYSKAQVERNNIYNQKYPERKKEYDKKYKEEHKEYYKEYKKAYYLKQKALKSSALYQQPLEQL